MFGPTMHSADLWRRTLSTPRHLRQLICLLLLLFEHIGERRGELFHRTSMVEEVHLIVFISHLVRKAASPSFDGVELMTLLVVSIPADVDLCAFG